MARGRMLNKSVSCSRKVAELIDKAGPWGGVFWTWMIAHLDREGRIHGDPEVLKGLVAPRVAGITPAIIRQTAATAHELGLIVWYEAGGDSFIEFPGFGDNQVNMRKDREPESDIPSPTSDVSRHFAGTLPEGCRQVAGRLPSEGKGREVEEKGREHRARSSARCADSAPAVLNLELTPKDGEYPITAEMVTEWQESFPGVDVMAELRKACQWAKDNPSRRKTKRGARKFLGAWLGRVQDRGGGRQQPQRQRTWIDAQRELMEEARRADEPTSGGVGIGQVAGLLPPKNQ